MIFALLTTLLTTAWAGAPEADLTAAELAANTRIDACRAAPESCVGSENALARAFLVRVTASSVLRGEIDRVAAANARLLDREVVADWSVLLPTDESTQPDPWVLALAAAAWSTRARADGCCAPEPKAPSGPPKVRQVVVELTGSSEFLSRSPTGGAHATTRLGFDPPLGLRFDLWTLVLPSTEATPYSETDPTLPAGRSLRVGQPSVSAGGSVSAGWWRALPRAGENLLTAGLVLTGQQATARAGDALYANYGYAAAPAMLGAGLELRELLRYPLDHTERVFFAGDLAFAAIKRTEIGRGGPALAAGTWSNTSNTTYCGLADCNAPDQLNLELGLGVEWRPKPSARIGLGGRLRADLTSPRSPSSYLGLVELRLGWASARAASARLGEVDHAVRGFLAR